MTTAERKEHRRNHLRMSDDERRAMLATIGCVPLEDIVRELGALDDVKRALEEMGLPPITDSPAMVRRSEILAGLARHHGGITTSELLRRLGVHPDLVRFVTRAGGIQDRTWTTDQIADLVKEGGAS